LEGVVKRFLVAAIVLLPALCFSQTIRGEGRVTVTGGWRLTTQGYFENSARNAGTPVSEGSHGGPTGVASFGYGVNDSVEISVDLFAGTDQLTLSGQSSLRMTEYGASVGARWFGLFAQGHFRPWVGLLTGPTIVDVSGGNLSKVSESLVQALMLTLGASWRLGENWGASVDYHLVLARGMVPGVGGISAGGNWFGLGFTYYFAPEPDHTPTLDF
jgi:hypothetical protein